MMEKYADLLNSCIAEKTLLADLLPQNLSYTDAFGIQNQVGKSWGHWVGWKIGMDKNGEKVSAPLFEKRFYRSGACLERNAFQRCLVEPELAFVMGSDFMINKAQDVLEDFYQCVSGISVGIEVCDSRLQSWPECPLPWQLADLLSHGAYVLGSGVSLDNSADKIALMKEATFSFEVLEENHLSKIKTSKTSLHPFRHLDEILRWFLSDLQKKSILLKKGHVITTGSFNGGTPVLKGDEVSVVFAGIGEAKVCFT